MNSSFNNFTMIPLTHPSFFNGSKGPVPSIQAVFRFLNVFSSYFLTNVVSLPHFITLYFYSSLSDTVYLRSIHFFIFYIYFWHLFSLFFTCIFFCRFSDYFKTSCFYILHWYPLTSLVKNVNELPSPFWLIPWLPRLTIRFLSETASFLIILRLSSWNKCISRLH